MSDPTDPTTSPRMVLWAFFTALLMVAALAMQDVTPGSVVAVTLYKAHLMALGGWGGYWLDRALFPYDRPHEYLAAEPPVASTTPADGDEAAVYLQATATGAFGHAMIRRAIVVAACLICVGLGA